MNRLTHVSRRKDDTGTTGFSNDFLEIAEHAKVQNAKLNITGFLICTPTWYAQVLEGDREVIEALLQRVLKDHRHFDVQVLSREDITTRLFSDWDMGWRHFTIGSRIIFLEHGLAPGDPPEARQSADILQAAIELTQAPTFKRDEAKSNNVFGHTPLAMTG